MKKTILFWILILPAYLFATSFHTILINGLNSGWTANERFSNISSADSAYVTWDNNYLYFGSKGNAASDSLLNYIFIDSDPCGSNGSDSVYANGNYILLTYKADYVILMRNAGTRYYTEVRKYNNTTHAWDLYGSSNSNVLNVNEVSFSIGANYRECRIKRSTIGNAIAFKITSLSEMLSNNIRTMVFPSEGWTDVVNAPSQHINHYYAFQWISGISPNSITYFDLLTSSPLIVQQSHDTTLCEGTPLSFYVRSTGTGPLSFQWKKNGIRINGATDSVYLIAGINSTNAGTYTCVVKNLCDSVTTGAAVLIVNTLPSNGFNNDWTIIYGTDTTIALSPSGTLPIAYQWSKSGIDIPGDTNFYKHYLNIDSTSRGDYTCRMTNVCGTYIYNYHVYVVRPVCGNISVNTSWNVDVIKVNCDINVDDQKTLSISRGTVVRFMGNYKINVAGRILANGTSSMPVSFIVNDTTGYSNVSNSNGGWHGIRFDNVSPTNDTSRFNYCNFMNGKATGTGNDRCGGVLFVKQTSKLTISNCNFTNNRSIGDGGAVYSLQSNIRISNSVFRTNKASGNAGAVYLKKSSCNLTSNIFNSNQSLNVMGFGGALYMDTCTIRFVNSLISRNSARYGAGIFMNVTSAEVNNNTIAENTGAIMAGGLFCVSSNPSFTNCILYDNVASSFGSQVYLDPNSDPNFYYCDIKGGTASFGGPGAGTNYTGTYLNNLDSNPAFVNNLTGDYKLMHSSPCINSGSTSIAGLFLPAEDLAGNSRLNGSRIDMGAYEYKLVINSCGAITQNTIWDADTVMVNCDITVDNNATLTINPGTVVKFMGLYKLIINGRILAIGEPNRKITFISADTVNGWRGLRIINSSSDTSRIVYANFYFGNLIQMPPVPLYDDYGGSVFIQNSPKVLISGCLIEKGQAVGGGAIAIINSSPVIRKNTIAYNKSLSSGNGGGIYTYNSNSLIYNNIITNNTCSTGNGGGVALISSNDILQNNIISNNNSVTALYIDATGCSCSPRLINNTITNNQNKGLYINASNVLSVYNTIIYGGQNPAVDIQSTVNFYHCDINAPILSLGPGIIENVIDTDPQFISATAGNGSAFDGLSADWAIKGCSPCFNRGKTDTTGLHLLPFDFAGNVRIWHDTIDIGAYETKKPAINMQPQSSQVCQNMNALFNVSLNSTIAVNFQWQLYTGGVWQNASGSVDDTLTIYNVQPVMNGNQYRCRISAECSDTLTTNPVLMTVLTPPFITGEPVNSTVCEGGDTSFIVSATGSNLTYQWQVSTNGGALWQNITGNPTALTNRYELHNVCASCLANTTFRCIVSGACQPSVTSVTVNITVNLIPRVTAQPADITLCQGGNASFLITATGTALSYQWQISRDGGATWNDSTGAVSNAVTINNITATMNGFRYRCKLSNMCNSAVYSLPATLSVSTRPNLTAQPVSAGVCAGVDTSFTAHVTGSGLIYRWQISTNGGSSWSDNGVGTATMPVNHALISQNNYLYRCIYSGVCPGGDTTNTVVLSVYALPHLDLGPDFTMMKTDTSILHAGSGFNTYLWNNTPIWNDSILSVIGMNVSGNNPHTYFVNVTEQHGCQAADTVLITIIDNTEIENLSPGDVILYPNPTNGILKLNISTLQFHVLIVEIIDPKGSSVYMKTIEQRQNEMSLNISGLKKGIYFVKLVTAKENIIRKLIIN